MTTHNDPDARLAELLRTPTPGPARDEERPTADRIADKVEQVRDKAQEGVEQVRQRAQEAGHEAATRVDAAMNTTGEKLSEAARKLRENAPSGQAGEVAQGAARAMDRGGEYLRSSDLEAVRDDLETLVREHPIESLAIGFGVGFLIARSARPRRGHRG